MLIYLSNTTIITILNALILLSLKKKSLPITMENINAYSFMKNKSYLVEIGYSNIDPILDIFYDNPLKAMSYLASKKKLTKKELDELQSLLVK